jgi:hypothetical protein
MMMAPPLSQRATPSKTPVLAPMTATMTTTTSDECAAMRVPLLGSICSSCSILH